MGWDKGGRYYTRSKRVNGRVVREYIGGGGQGRLAAEHDARQRQKRRDERARALAELAELAILDALLDEFCAFVDLVVEAHLSAQGYRKHRGQWRKQRTPRQ